MASSKLEMVQELIKRQDEEVARAEAGAKRKKATVKPKK